MLARTLIAALTLGLATPVLADAIPFNGQWKTQRFSLFSSNTYGFGGNTLSIASDGSVSLAYVRVPRALWGSERAQWSWQITQSVPATDLAKKGGDDRNASLYFVFLPQAQAEALGAGADVRKLLQADSARVLLYVWGDNRKRGAIVPSPYLGSRGKTITLRAAGTGRFAETVDLAADYKRAFGGTIGALVGIAVSADSDDTKSVIRGSLSGLRVE